MFEQLNTWLDRRWRSLRRRETLGTPGNFSFQAGVIVPEQHKPLVTLCATVLAENHLFLEPDRSVADACVWIGDRYRSVKLKVTSRSKVPGGEEFTFMVLGIRGALADRPLAKITLQLPDVQLLPHLVNCEELWELPALELPPLE